MAGFVTRERRVNGDRTGFDVAEVKGGVISKPFPLAHKESGKRGGARVGQVQPQQL